MAVWLLLLRWKKIEWRSKGLFWVNSLSGPISWRNSDSGAAAAFALQTFWVYTTLKIRQSSIYVMIRLIHKKSNRAVVALLLFLFEFLWISLYAGLLGWWENHLIDQVSDVPSIIFFLNFLQNTLQKGFQFILLFF